MVVFIGYLAIQPKVPFVSVTYAHVDKFEYITQSSVLNTEISIVFKAQNDNAKAHVSFSEFVYYLKFHGLIIAKLQNHAFEVNKNDSVTFNYDVKSYSIPLDLYHSAMVDRSYRENRISFDLIGRTRTRWRVGPFKSVKFWLHLNCELKFQLDGINVDSHCTTKSK